MLQNYQIFGQTLLPSTTSTQNGSGLKNIVEIAIVVKSTWLQSLFMIEEDLDYTFPWRSADSSFEPGNYFP